MNKKDCIDKIQILIETGIADGIYEKTTDNTVNKLEKFQDFLYRNFKNFKIYDGMRPTSNQPAHIYGTAKTHKFDNFDEITLNKLKLRQIIAQNGTFTYNAAQVIGNYLKPLVAHNNYIIKNTQDFPKLLKDQPSLGEHEDYVSYDIVSLFTNIPIHERIDYIIKKMYDEKKLPIICSKLSFKRLLLKLTTYSTFIFQNQFHK